MLFIIFVALVIVLCCITVYGATVIAGILALVVQLYEQIKLN